MKHIDSDPPLQQSRAIHVHFCVKRSLPDFQTQILLKIRIMIPFSFSLEWVPGHLFKIAAEIEWGDGEVGGGGGVEKRESEERGAYSCEGAY